MRKLSNQSDAVFGMTSAFCVMMRIGMKMGVKNGCAIDRMCMRK